MRQLFERESEFVLIDEQTKKRVELVHRTTAIGRNSVHPVVINDISVSLKHAQIEIQDVPATVARAASKRCYVVDLGAQNGTWHNRQKLIQGARQRLRHNDILSFGK